jgi:hypothetical protein
VLRKILIMGLPGAGKTTLAKALAPRLNAVRFNGDDVRTNVNRDLGLLQADRIEHARRMGWLCDRVTGWRVCHRRFYLPDLCDARGVLCWRSGRDRVRRSDCGQPFRRYKSDV